MTRPGREARTPRALAPSAVVRVVAQWAEHLHSALDPSHAAQALLPALAVSTGATRASVMLVNPNMGRLRIVAGLGLPRESVGQDLPPAPRRISDWVLREGRSLIMNGEIRDERFESSGPRDRIASAMSVPLPGTHGVIGVLNLSRVGTTIPFTEEDLDGLETASAAIAAIFERVNELAVARRHWRRAESRMPLSAAPDGRAASLAISILPGTVPSPDVCTQQTRSDGTLLVMIAEPFGAPVPALLAAEWLRGMFHASARRASGVAALAAEMDAGLREHRPGEGARAWFGSLTTNGQLSSCAAGYPPPFCLPSEGSAGERLIEGGPPLGTAGAPGDYEATALRLLPGDGLLVVSDGVLQATSLAGHGFGEPAVLGLLHDLWPGSIEPLVDALTESARKHVGLAVPTDDLLAFALRFTRHR